MYLLKYDRTRICQYKLKEFGYLGCFKVALIKAWIWVQVGSMSDRQVLPDLAPTLTCFFATRCMMLHAMSLCTYRIVYDVTMKTRKSS